MKRGLIFIIILSILVIMSFVSASCYDTDATSEYPDGKNYYKRGEVYVNGIVVSIENCVNTYQMSEAYCGQDNLQLTTFTCPNGCDADGAVCRSVNQTCTPNPNVCSNRTCGNWQNGTCGTVSCGTCSSGYTCNINGQCTLSTNQTANLFLISPDGKEIWITGKTYGIGWATNGIPIMYLKYHPWAQILTLNNTILYEIQSSDTMVNNDDYRFGRWPFTIPTDKGLDGKYIIRIVIKDATENILLSLQSKDYIHISNNQVTRDCPGNISSQIFPPLRNSEFGNLGLDISKHPEIIIYRIQWFSGGWSEWYTPGVDDIDWKVNDDGTKRRVWGYFGDHIHEIEICGRGKNYTFSNDEIEIRKDARKIFETSTGEIFQCENGCRLDNDCYPYNNRKNGNYCAVGGVWITQVQDDGTCENHFECSSNVCVSGQCVEGDLIQKILAWFRKLFGNE